MLFAILSCRCAVSAEDNPAAWGDRIEQASSRMNIFALPSFEIKAKVQIENSSGKTLDGSYVLLWNGSGQWKEQILFPGYEETEIGKGGFVLIKRSLDYLPLRIDQLHSTLGFGAGGAREGMFFNQGLKPKETITKVRRRGINGHKAQCAEIHGDGTLSREVCIDDASNTLVRPGFNDSSPLPVGSKLFPRNLELIEEGKPIVKVQITDFNTDLQFSSSLFDAPREAVSRTGCMNPTPARRVVHKIPKYPEQDKRTLTQGTVAVYAVIDTNGVPNDLHIVASVSASIDKASLDALRENRFNPATCNGNPVDSETILKTTFTAGH